MSINLIDGNGYVLSENIKVFPCAYRGYDSTNNRYFNPESRTTSEYSFVNSFHKFSSRKVSYIVDWKPSSITNGNDAKNGVLKFVLGGYYFEIHNCTITDFVSSTDKTKVKNFYINVGDATVKNNNSTEMVTSVLKSFEKITDSDGTVFDELYLDTNKANNYRFTGLKIVDSEITSGITNELVPFTYRFIETSKPTKIDDYVGKYIFNETNERYTEITNSNKDTLDSEDLPTAYIVEYSVNPQAYPITNLLDNGEGRYSLRMLEDIEDSTDNTTEALGDYSIALGKNTIASGFASTALGSNTTASGNTSTALGNASIASGNSALAVGNSVSATGDYSFATGNCTEAKSNYAAAFGYYTTADANNQVVIGQYNTPDATQAFIIANGSSTEASNKFTVSYDGDVKATGDLEISGNSDLNGSLNVYGNIQLDKPDTVNDTDNTKYDTSNNLILGKYDATNKYSGTISVYGQNPEDTDDKVFSVSNTGKTYIADTTDATSSDGALKVAGGVIIDKKLNVGTNTTIGGTLTADGNTILGGDSTANIVDIKKSPGENEVNVKITGTTEITNNAEITGELSISKDTESTSTTTGALKVTGGVGIGLNLNVGGDTNLDDILVVKTSPEDSETNVGITGTLNVTSTTTIASNATISTDKTTLEKPVEITNTTSSTSTTTGALIVSGGAGITGNVNIDGNINSIGTITSSGNITSGGSLTLSGVDTDTHELILGANNSNSNNKNSGSITVYTSAGNTGFSVNESGNAAIYGKLEIGTNTTTTSPKVTLNGGAIETTGDAKFGGTLTADAVSTTSTPITHTIGSVEIAGGEVSNITTLSAQSVEISNQLSASSTTAEHTIGAITIQNDTLSGVGNLSVSGYVEAAYFNAITTTTSSDARLKCNIEDYKFNKSILDLPIKRFEYINDESHTKYIGCIAQDLQQICPELVVENKDGMLSIQESKLIYLLLQEVKELKHKVELLERR